VLAEGLFQVRGGVHNDCMTGRRFGSLIMAMAWVDLGLMELFCICVPRRS
jgi:hypothetical protein